MEFSSQGRWEPSPATDEGLRDKSEDNWNTNEGLRDKNEASRSQRGSFPLAQRSFVFGPGTFSARVRAFPVPRRSFPDRGWTFVRVPETFVRAPQRFV